MESNGAFSYSDSIETNIERNHIMNILKNMEAIFLVSLAIAGPASVLVDMLPVANASRTPVAAVASQQAIPVVVVSARRMTDEEKRQSLEEEARDASFKVASRGNF